MSIYTFENLPSRTAILNGKEYLFFSGYSYLGMQCVPEFIDLINEGIKKYGWLFPSSRISNTQLSVYKESEDLLSAITGKEDTVIVSNGFTAGKLATKKWKSEIINLHPSHPAIKRNATTHEQKQKVFAIDSCDTLTANITDFSFSKNDNESKIIIVDDSHGFGVLGNNGEGIVSSLPLNIHNEFVISYSLSKAMHVIAGAISCTKELATEIRSMPQYTACTPPSPAMLYAFTKAKHLYTEQLEKLKRNILYFESLISEIKGIVYNRQLPVFILPSYIDEKKFAKEEIIISSFSYPTISGEKVNRVVLNALHTKNDLEKLAETIAGMLK